MPARARGKQRRLLAQRQGTSVLARPIQSLRQVSSQEVIAKRCAWFVERAPDSLGAGRGCRGIDKTSPESILRTLMPARGRGKQRRAGCSHRGRGRCLVRPVPSTGIIAGRSLQSDAHGLWGGLLLLWSQVGVQGNRQNLSGEHLAHPYACARARKAATIGRLLAQRQGTMSRSSSPIDRHHRREVIAKRCAWFVQRAPAPLVASRGAGESTKPLRRASCAPLCLREGEENSDGQVARTEAGDDVSFIQSHRQASSPGGHCKATRMVCGVGS